MSDKTRVTLHGPEAIRQPSRSGTRVQMHDGGLPSSTSVVIHEEKPDSAEGENPSTGPVGSTTKVTMHAPGSDPQPRQVQGRTRVSHREGGSGGQRPPGVPEGAVESVGGQIGGGRTRTFTHPRPTPAETPPEALETRAEEDVRLTQEALQKSEAK